MIDVARKKERVCVYIFNGRRPVPITRVPPIPCWDKGRQEVSPRRQRLPIYSLYIHEETLRRVYIAAVVREVGR